MSVRQGLAGLPAVELPRRAAADGSLPLFLAQAALAHGPIFRALIPAGRDAGREVVFMAGPAANRFVLHTHREHFSHDQGWTPVLGAAVGQGLLNEDQPRDVLGMIVHARDEQGLTLTDEQVVAHLNILLVAGHETTTTFSTWALYLLALLPEHRERIRAEIDRSIRDDASLTPAALQAMPWLDCFFREVGRLYSPVLNLLRGVIRPFTFDGYTIPVGTSVRLALAFVSGYTSRRSSSNH